MEDGATRKTRSRSARLGGGQPGGGLVGDQVGGDRARSPGGGEVGGEALDAVALDRVPVAHHHRDGAGRGHRLDGAEHVAHADAGPDGDVDRLLDHRPVHARVAVRDADLDDVRAALDGRHHRRDRGVDVGVADRQVGDQRGPALGLGLADALGQRCSRLLPLRPGRPPPSSLLTAPSVGCWSVSRPGPGVDLLAVAEPEPARRGLDVLVAAAGQVHQQQRVRARVPCRARSAPASACADSIAGMMPSVRQSSANASIASASVTARYSARPMSCR